MAIRVKKEVWEKQESFPFVISKGVGDIVAHTPFALIDRVERFKGDRRIRVEREHVRDW